MTTRDRCLKDCRHTAEFYELFEFKVSYPSVSTVRITCKDYDLLGEDDIIGETIIDLEDLLEAWQKRQDDRGKIGDRILCLSMFSHRWSRPSLDRDAAHPDTEDGLKARSLAEYGRGGTCSVFPNHKFDYFFWIE